MEKSEFIEFQTIRSSISFDNPEYLTTYLNEVYLDLIERSDIKNGINKLTFYEYIKVPLIISDKLFLSLDRDDDGLLNGKEFTNGLFQLFQGNFEETAQIIFNIFDFNRDGLIHKWDVKLLLSYLPLKEEYDICHKKQLESLEELDEILNLSFKEEKGVDFKNFLKIIETVKSDIYLQLLCFLYQNKPFQISKINLFKNHKKKKCHTMNSFKKSEISRKRLISPDKNTRFNCYDNFCINLRKSKTGSESGSMSPEKTTSSKTPIQSPNLPPRDITKKPIDKHRGSLKGDESSIKNPLPVTKRGSFDMVRMCNQKVLGSNKKEESLKELLLNSENVFNSPSKLLGNNSKVEPLSLETDIKSVENEKHISYEDAIWLLDSTTKKMKKYRMVLIGKGIIIYDSNKKDEHEYFHNLSGCFIKLSDREKVVDKEKYKYFSIILSKSLVKDFFTLNQDSCDTWIHVLKQTIGYQQFTDIYEITEDVGQGKFGTVKLGIHKTTGQKVAVKIINKETLEPEDFELIKTEIDLMKLFRHPNLVKLLDHFENYDYVYIVMEYLLGGDLLTYIKEKKVLKEARAAKIIYNVALGINYLNSFGIVHRDLKPENIILVDSSESSSVKIIDFGLTKTLAPGEKMNEWMGTINYIAPEVLNHQPYGKQIDVWSLGIILYLMLSGFLPFDDISSSEEKIIQKTIHMEPSYPEETFGKVSKGAIRLINHCLEKNPEKRITIEEFLKNEWLKKNI
jgi:hypothetical protein